MSDRNLMQLEKQFYMIDQQAVTIDDFDSSGFILDIGGGGEGIIGMLKGDRVIAIDPLKSELEEAPDGPLKIVMDARDLQFLDGSFNTVTSFFTLMYLKNKSDYETVFNEVFRVLNPGGDFLIWDVSVPKQPEGEMRKYLVLLKVWVKDRLIETGYAQPWPDEDHDLSFYVGLAENCGFKVKEKQVVGHLIILQLSKP